MKIVNPKKLAASVSGCSPKRIKYDTSRLDEIKEAITKADVRSLINKGAIRVVQKKGTSRFRAKKTHIQRVKGRMRGHGSRKGNATARSPSKRDWINRIRLLRQVIKNFKDKKLISNQTYRDLYLKAKGGFFRSKRHMRLYMDERGLIKNESK